MGTFSTGGIAAEMARFNGLAKGVDGAAKAAVQAGAKVLVQELKDSAPQRTGGLQASLHAEPVKWSTGDGYHCEVGSGTRKNSRGESYAKIGNILEYGRKNMPPRPWFNPTVQRAESSVVAVMEHTFNDAMEKG